MSCSVGSVVLPVAEDVRAPRLPVSLRRVLVVDDEADRLVETRAQRAGADSAKEDAGRATGHLTAYDHARDE